jgi:tripartite-type tricarboxylate transporter receptor subunit TctC
MTFAWIARPATRPCVFHPLKTMKEMTMKPETIDQTRRKLIANASKLPLAMAAGAAGMFPAAASAKAEEWPRKTIRVIVPFPAGALTDTITRMLADGLSKFLGQPVMVENKLGANGVIGVSELARAPADGHTLLVTNSSSITVNPLLYKKIPYKASDLAPITPLLFSPFVLIVNPEWAQKNKITKLSDLITYARNNPGALRYGSPGIGNLAHLSSLMMNNRAGVDTLHIPYKGGSLAQAAILSGEIEFVFDTWAGLPLIKAGKVLPLAVTSLERARQLPSIPTFAESGIPNFSSDFWLGLFAPAGTPAAITQKLYAASKAVMEDPKTLAALGAQGDIVLQEPAAFADRIKAETLTWAGIIKREGIAID